jgi:hypothetical protein
MGNFNICHHSAKTTACTYQANEIRQSSIPITFFDMNDTCQPPCRGEVESPARRQGSSTVSTLIYAGWLPHFVPPSRGCLGLCTCVRTFEPCTNEGRGFPVPDSFASGPTYLWFFPRETILIYFRCNLSCARHAISRIRGLCPS